MAQLQQAADKAKVFISYSRHDSSKLAEELLAGLERAGFDAFLDKHDIEKAEAWEERLKSLIIKADAVVYIISPRSVRSSRCGWEVDRAAEFGKRLIPVQWIQVPEAEVPDRLKRLNYIFFEEGKSIAQPLAEVIKALTQDLDWIRQQTLIGEQAVRWKARGGPADDLLLRGNELAEAKAWQQCRKPDSPEVTEMQRKFLIASEEGEARRLVRARRVKTLVTTLGAALVVGGLSWWQGDWIREKYFWFAHVRNHVTAAAPDGLAPGSSGFRDCPQCPEMVVVPAGHFMIGSPDGQGEPSEWPRHEVVINKRIAVSRFEVTFDEWDTCVTYGNCNPNISAKDWGRDRQPVINISFDDAGTYVAWLSRVTGMRYRLLSEAEWEYAARAKSETIFTFGNSDEMYLASYAWFAGNAERRSHPVGLKKANGFGMHDVHGNVKEWTLDCWANDYRATPANGSANAVGNCNRRVVRGGSWLYRPPTLRSASREWLPADTKSDELGMRIARELPE